MLATGRFETEGTNASDNRSPANRDKERQRGRQNYVKRAAAVQSEWGNRNNVTAANFDSVG